MSAGPVCLLVEGRQSGICAQKIGPWIHEGWGCCDIKIKRACFSAFDFHYLCTDKRKKDETTGYF